MNINRISLQKGNKKKVETEDLYQHYKLIYKVGKNKK